MALGTNLNFYTSVATAIKLKVRKFTGLILTFAEVTEEKQRFLSKNDRAIAKRNVLLIVKNLLCFLFPLRLTQYY